MAITTLRPDTTHQFPGTGWSIQGGSSDADDALRDDSDVTFLRADENRCEPSKAAIVGLQDFTLPAGSRIEQVRVRAKIKDRHATKHTFAAAYLRLNNIDASPVNNSGGEAAFTEFSGPWATTRPGGGEWTDTDIDNLRVAIYSCGDRDDSVGSEWAAIYVDVEYNYAPTVTATTPAEGAAILDRTRPTLEAEYADTESDTMEAYRFKVWTAAVYGGVGFNPETSTSVYDSGWVSSSTSPISVVMPVDLQTGSYVFGAKVRQEWPSALSDYESSWDYNAFTVSVTPPRPPLIEATGATDDPIEVVVTGQDNIASLDSSTFESTVGGWTARTNIAATYPQRTTTAGQFDTGAAGMVVRSAAAGDFTVQDQAYPAAPGELHKAWARIKAAVTGRQVKLRLRYLDASNNVLQTDTSGNLGATVTGAFTTYSWDNPTPAPAGTTQVRQDIVFVGATAANEDQYVDNAGITPGGVTTWGPGGLVYSGEQTVDVDFSDDGGETWAEADHLWNPDTDERGGYGVLLARAGQTVTLLDYEAVPRQERIYRARTYDPSPVVIAGEWSAESDPAIWIASSFRLHVPTDPSLNIRLDRDDSAFTFESEEPTSVNWPQGSPFPILVKGKIRGRTIPLALQFEEKADWEAFEAIRSRQEVLWLATDMDDARYVALMGVESVSVDRTVGNVEPWWHSISVSVIEQDRP